jgi:Sec23/Sec24 trunk domain
VYFFVIDVSDVSIASGMITSMVAAIKDSIEELAANTRTQIGPNMQVFSLFVRACVT